MLLHLHSSSSMQSLLSIQRRRRCDTLAAFVARNGPALEATARERQRGDPRFSFLLGGEGAAYYLWRRAQLGAAPPPPPPQTRAAPMTAEQRGLLLGEEPPPPPPPPKGIAASDRAALLESLGRTFTRSVAEAPHAAQPGMSRPVPAAAAALTGRFATGGMEVAGAAAAAAAAAAARLWRRRRSRRCCPG